MAAGTVPATSSALGGYAPTRWPSRSSCPTCCPRALCHTMYLRNRPHRTRARARSPCQRRPLQVFARGGERPGHHHPPRQAGATTGGFESEEDWFDYLLENDPHFIQRVESARKDLRAGRFTRLEDLEPPTSASVIRSANPLSVGKWAP